MKKNSDCVISNISIMLLLVFITFQISPIIWTSPAMSQQEDPQNVKVESSNKPDSSTSVPVESTASGGWRLVGAGDCTGRDVSGSTGPNPDNLKCTDAFRDQTAVCWEQSCTYKNIETGSCTGGTSIGQMYTCVPNDSGGKKADSVTPIISKGMQPLTPPSDHVIYTNGNNRAVQNGPKRATTFVIDSPHLVTFIYTYHYLNGGKLPGKIGLKHADGTIYGPWRAEGAIGPGGIPNAYWFVLPYVELKAGNYTVTDSDAETWSYNRRSSNAGFVVIHGIRR